MINVTLPYLSLKNAVKFVTPCSPHANDLIEITATPRRLSLTLADPVAEISSATPAQVKTPGKVFIHGRLLHNFLDVANIETEVNLVVSAETPSQLICSIGNHGVYSFDLSTPVPSPVSTGPFSETIPSIPITGMEGLPWLSFLEAAHDENIGACILMEASTLYLMTTNLFTINAVIIKQKSTFSDFVLPLSLAHLKKLLLLNPTSVRFDYERRYYRFKTNQAALSLRPAFNDFPDVTEILKTLPSNNITLHRPALVNALTRLGVASPAAVVFLSLQENEIAISDGPQSTSSNWEKVASSSLPPDNLTIEFNPRYVHKALLNSPTPEVSLLYDPDSSPIYFQCQVSLTEQALSVVMAQSIKKLNYPPPPPT